MKKLHIVLMTLTLSLLVFSCKTKETEKRIEEVKVEQETEEENALLPKNRKDLITIKNNQYIEYYPGKKQIKFHGFVNDDEQREGKWIFYGENGEELSVSYYKNGEKNGHSIVKYPDGRLRYVGEYENGKKIGKWDFYSEDGVKTTKNY